MLNFRLFPGGRRTKTAVSHWTSAVAGATHEDSRLRPTTKLSKISIFLTASKDSLSAWIKASRPKTLGASICPVFVGSAFAFVNDTFEPAYFWLILFAATLLQILANVINDYGDFLRGNDSINRLGPPRAMQMGWISKSSMQMGIVLILLCALTLGLLLAIHGGWPIWLVGILGMFTCFWYSLGKKPLSHIGLAEVVIFFIFGPVEVMGSFFIHSFSFRGDVLMASMAPGFLAAALSLTNNLRDIVEDARFNKKTLAVRLGEKMSRYVVISFILLSSLGPLILVALYGYSLWILICLFALWPALLRIKIILFAPISKQFNLVLAAVGQTLILFGLLFSLSIIYYGF
jgi:1,4-dihydroxy-2-naphthoate octaprenyltransferase